MTSSNQTQAPVRASSPKTLTLLQLLALIGISGVAVSVLIKLFV